MLPIGFRTGSTRSMQSGDISNEEGPPVKLRVAGLIAATLVLLPGAASAQWYEHGPQHYNHHHRDHHRHPGHGYGHDFERHRHHSYDRPVHFERGGHHHHRRY
ncbi:hypothetical protein Maq22A_c14285 [Methylobacterium aquaticum]|uniref:Uncharacterized protein n=1 Tax=Methylobacterium aquaticum TaxID=270351 RepID=A0A0C6FT12_9HYPH|nr:hypothetical protein Maq22A_c14285 [Methylobacterium aquaticum]